MLNLLPAKAADSEYRILCLGAHSDDIEIGCGGTILRLLETYPNVNVTWVVFSATGSRGKEAQSSAEDFLKDAKTKKIILKEFRDGFFPYTGGAVKEVFEDLKEVQPDIVLTHYRNDLHQDHRVICELTWNTFRDHLVMEYEIPKFDGDLGQPNFFVEVDKQICNQKIELLQKHFNTQQNKPWFTDETFAAILRLRGVECRSRSSYAEAFYCRKAVLG